MADRKTRRIALACLVALIVAIALFWFVKHRPLRTERSLEVKMSTVESELERVIDGWCDAEAGSYTKQTGLQGLWRRKFPTTPAYNPHGLTKLISGIGDNELFRNCDAAKQIGPGFFLPGGAIQTVGDLADFLTPCA